MDIFYSQVKPVIDFSVRELCKRPYYLHKKGCPNFNKRNFCPPKISTIDKILDLDKPIYIIYNRFNFYDHVKKMRIKHSNWSSKQLECCLYWQGTARKQLKDKIIIFKKLYPNLFILKSPEACGVNLTATMEKIGIDLEWPPKKYTYQIVLSGESIKG